MLLDSVYIVLNKFYFACNSAAKIDTYAAKIEPYSETIDDSTVILKQVLTGNAIVRISINKLFNNF